MGDIAHKAAEHGINVFRGMLEDDDEHYEDALRTGMFAAASEALRKSNQGAVDEVARLRDAIRRLLAAHAEYRDTDSLLTATLDREFPELRGRQA